MVGGYDAFPLPKYIEDDRKEGFMVPYARAVRQAVPGMPVIAAGRLQSPAFAEKVLQEGSADLVGLGRVLFADSQWPRKARGEVAEAIEPCQPGCILCTRRIVEQKPAYCARWPDERRRQFLARVGE
jgi:2,4-dienoyl-CoA reductase (NADPH2)